MLEIRTNCEHCNRSLPNESNEAMICTFECTFCENCVDQLFHNVCPNCGGGFTKRPTRPKRLLAKYPLTEKVVYKPVDMEKFKSLLEKFRDIPPRDR